MRPLRPTPLPREAGVTALTLLLVGCASGVPSIPIASQARGTSVLVTCAVECGTAPAEAVVWAEAAAEVAADLFGVAPRAFGRMHLARDIEEYESLERRATGGWLRSNLALSKPEWRTSIVAIQPSVDEDALARTGLPMQTLRLVAHEMSHLVSYAAMPPPRGRVPGWLEEGVAILVETETRVRFGLLPERAGDDPLLSTYLIRIAEVETAGRLPGVGDLLDDRNGDLSGGEVYAARALLMLALAAEDREAVRAGLQAARARWSEGGGSEDMSDAFVTGFGGPDRVSAAFDAWRAEQRPMWRELGRSLSAAGDRWVQHAFASGAAHAVRTEAIGDSWQFSAVVRMGGTDPAAAITLGAADGIVAYVRVTPTEVALVREAPREVLARLPRPNPPEGERDAAVRIEIHVDGELVTVRSDAGDPRSARLGTPLEGPWGLLVRAGTWAVWEDVAAVR